MATNIKAGLHKIKMNALSCAEINLPCRPKWTFPTWILTSSVWIWLLHTLTLMHTLTLQTLRQDGSRIMIECNAARCILHFSQPFSKLENFHICPIFVLHIYLSVTSTSIFARYLYSVFIFQLPQLPYLPDICSPYLSSRVNVACMLPGWQIMIRKCNVFAFFFNLFGKSGFWWKNEI